MSNLEIAARMARNGWPVLRAEPFAKQTYLKWGGIRARAYNWNEAMNGAAINCNVAVLTDDLVCVVDIDSHGIVPSAEIFEELDPSVYDGCIVEQTASGGYHIYYKGFPGYKTTRIFLPGGATAEVLTGRRICYSWPSVTEKGEYNIISPNTFMTTRPEQLPALHPLWYATWPEVIEHRPEQVPAFLSDDMTADDVEAAIDYYTHLCQYKGESRHSQARAMCRCLAGLGLSQREITRHAKDFLDDHGRGQTDHKEAERLAEYGMKNPLTGKPWRHIQRMRLKKQTSKLAKILGASI